MKLFRAAFAFLIIISVTQLTQAQEHEFVPHGMDALRQGASSKTEFTLDHSMLVFASKMDPDNLDLRRVIAGLSGVSVHHYRFPEPGMYDPGVLSSVKQEYQTAGWTQLVNNHEKGGGPGVTDVWVRLENNAICNVAILVARPTDVNLILVSV